MSEQVNQLADTASPTDPETEHDSTYASLTATYPSTVSLFAAGARVPGCMAPPTPPVEPEPKPSREEKVSSRVVAGYY